METPTGEPTPLDRADVGGPAGADQLRHLLDAVMVIGSDLDLPMVLRRIAETATELVGANFGALGVLDGERRSLSDFIAVGIDPVTRAAIGELPRGHGILGRLITDPRPLRLPDLTAHPDSGGFPPHHPPMSSFLGAPVLIRGQAYGNLYLCDKLDGHPFTDADEELVITLAIAAGIAIDNARLHAKVADITVMEDRDRIARDLHDTVIQRLFAIGLSLEGAAKGSDDDRAVQRMQTAVDDLDVTIKDIRTAIFELQPTRSAGTSTRRSAIDLVAESARNLGFEPTTRFDGPIDTALTGEVARHLLAVLREALANVSRHADASAVEVRLSVVASDVVLEVVDDGVGTPPARPAGGRGIENMSARAQSLGGRCTVAAGDERGTVVTWAVPLPGAGSIVEGPSDQ